MTKSIFIYFMLAVIFMATDSFAQGFGVKGSFDMFNMTIKDGDGDKTETGMVPKFDAGVFVELPVAPEFYIRPELLLATKGAKFKEATEKTIFNLMYIKLPVLFLYKGALSDGRILLGFGPYVAMGIGGKHKSGDFEFDVKFKNDVSDTDISAVYFKPADIGAMLMAGYELKGGFSIALNTSMGLTNIAPKVDGEKPDGSITNVGFGLTLGYLFGKN